MTAGPHPPAGQMLTASGTAEHRLAAAGPGVDTARHFAHLAQQRAITPSPTAEPQRRHRFNRGLPHSAPTCKIGASPVEECGRKTPNPESDVRCRVDSCSEPATQELP